MCTRDALYQRALWKGRGYFSVEFTFRCSAHISRLSFSPQQELAGCVVTVATVSLPLPGGRTSGRRAGWDGGGREMSCLAEQQDCKDKKSSVIKISNT